MTWKDVIMGIGFMVLGGGILYGLFLTNPHMFDLTTVALITGTGVHLVHRFAGRFQGGSQ